MKLKSGVCSVCDDGVLKPLVKGLCGYHYWGGKRVAVKKVSDKRREDNKVYSRLRIDFLTKRGLCEGKFSGCGYWSTDVHHLFSGKDRDKFFLDVSTWISVCRSCHDYIHKHNIKNF